MSAEDYFNDNETNEDVANYIQPEDLIANLKDKKFGPRARRVAAGIQRMAARLQKAIEEDERFGDEPAVGSVVTVTKSHRVDGLDYRKDTFTYVWFRSPAGWHATGRSTKIWSWDDVVNFIGDNTARVSHIDEWSEL